ncbi:GIY-YIG nuclease family protein [Kitasatospora sp. NPDC094028]
MPDEEYAELKRRVAAKELRWEQVAAKRTALYRLYDVSGALLYVGITTNPKSRFKGHRYGNGRNKPKEWWSEVADTVIEWFDSRPEAEAAEAFAIVTEHPRHNKAMADAWFTADFLHRWVQERLAGRPRPAPGAGPELWEGCGPLTSEIDGHRVPWQRWWSPHRPCGRLLEKRKADAVRLGLRFHDGSHPLLPAPELLVLTRYHRIECQACRRPFPCDVVRSVAARYTDHPQYALLWEHPQQPEDGGADSLG